MDMPGLYVKAMRQVCQESVIKDHRFSWKRTPKQKWIQAHELSTGIILGGHMKRNSLVLLKIIKVQSKKIVGEF